MSRRNLSSERSFDWEAVIPNVAVWCREQRDLLHSQLQVVPGDMDRRHALAQAELALGNLPRGFELFEARLFDRTAGTGWQTAQPRWSGQPVADGYDGTLYVQVEQGLGDAIMMARYLPLCAQRWAQVVCDVRPPLYQFFRDNFGSMIQLLSSAPIEYDYAIPMLSLPYAFRTTERTIPGTETPYLQAARYDRQFEGRIGIAWAGAPWHTNDRSRSMPRALVTALVQQVPGPWVSLQVDQPSPAPTVPEIRGVVSNVASTAAIVASLDLVVTVDTMLAHLAGALGVPCWVLLPYVPDWRWQLGRKDSPWYPSLRLFRQTQPGDWEGVLMRVSQALEARANRRA